MLFAGYVDLHVFLEKGKLEIFPFWLVFLRDLVKNDLR